MKGFKSLLCGVDREDDDSEPQNKPVKKGKKNKTDKGKEQTIPKTLNVSSESLASLSDGDTESHLIDRIPDPALRELFRKLQNERLQEEKKRQSRDLLLRNDLEIEIRLLEKAMEDKDEEITNLKGALLDMREAYESSKKETNSALDEINRLEAILNSFQDKRYEPQYRDDSECGKVVEAFGTLVVQLPKDEIGTTSKLSQKEENAVKEVKDAMRLVEKFIGPRWQEFAREINLPSEIIEFNEMSPDQRKTEIYWRIMYEWQKKEDVTVTKIITVCQNLGIDIYSDKPMSGQHKRALDRNRENILKDIEPKCTLNRMLKYLPIPTSLQDYVTSSEIRHRMAERLLDMLPVLGDEAFLVFYISLENIGQDFLADLLIEKPMPEEHKIILRKFEGAVAKYTFFDGHRIASCIARRLPQCMQRYLLEHNNSSTEKMKRLLEILPCLGHEAMDILIKTIYDTGCKDLASLLRGKVGEVERQLKKIKVSEEKALKKEVSTQISPDDVCVLTEETKAPLTGHRRTAYARPNSPNTRPDSPNTRPDSPNARLDSPNTRPDSPNTSDIAGDEELLWKDDYYASEMLTKEMEANAAMTDMSIEQIVDMDYTSSEPVKILKCLDRYQVLYRQNRVE
ncbi:uncharacterized protein [Argopecten irradians]|uniref:uncharacterized protein n=1 Tax=Argopecten irradians TaxID=31199 RepID=UPI00371B0FDC